MQSKKANIIKAVVSFPAIILEEVVEFFQRVFKDEEKIIEK